MAFDHDTLMGYVIPEARQTLTPRDCMLYALSVGMGADPLHAGELSYVYENGLQVHPMMANVIGAPGFWMKSPDTGIDWPRVLHGEQSVALHRPLPSSAEVVGRSRITRIIDKGVGKGALVYTERTVEDADSGEPIATILQTTFCRGDGGCGGPGGKAPAPHTLPTREADLGHEQVVLPQAALIYRLNGDYNPLHADPAVAASAGYDRPILHGLCTLGVAGNALLRTVCDHDAARLARFEVRFTAPVFPGETLRTEVWRDGAEVSFRCIAVERGIQVLGNGRALLWV